MKHKITLIASESKKEEFSAVLQDIANKFDLIDNADIFLVLGGDGSLNYLINTYPLKNLSEKKIIYFPNGSANDFAKSLKITPQPPTVSKLDSILRNAQTISIPVCSCNNKYFINVMAVGAAALVTESGDTLLKQTMGKVTYYLGAIEQLLSTSTYKYKFKSNDIEREVESPGFVISQGLYAGGGVKVSPAYCANFGKTFDFISLASDKLGHMISSAMELQKDEPDTDDLEIDICATDKVYVESEQEIPAKLDGEEYSAKSFLIQKSDYSLKFYIH